MAKLFKLTVPERLQLVVLLKQKGFTLIEMLMVLFIVQVMMFSIIVAIRPLVEYYKITLFLRQLQSDTFYVQQTAMNRESPIKINFAPKGAEYIVSDSRAVLYKRAYDSTIQITFGSGNSTIQYNKNGNISQAKTIFISNQKFKYKVTFQIGRGRFYVDKM
ncbi:competence type IV pilus minor pilin ComGD [Priestia megaterium]|uniref:competence type IV pilus minor pilin ComGD n=1 Tax=Priestia megaterium TaxID=1404 RepID=UPI001FD232D7|nr:competence type IV pilus minor pilin ComGD [Priestia megaterium]